MCGGVAVDIGIRDRLGANLRRVVPVRIIEIGNGERPPVHKSINAHTGFAPPVPSAATIDGESVFSSG